VRDHGELHHQAELLADLFSGTGPVRPGAVPSDTVASSTCGLPDPSIAAATGM
jgi:hypothetical protein